MGGLAVAGGPSGTRIHAAGDLGRGENPADGANVGALAFTGRCLPRRPSAGRRRRHHHGFGGLYGRHLQARYPLCKRAHDAPGAGGRGHRWKNRRKPGRIQKHAGRLPDAGIHGVGGGVPAHAPSAGIPLRPGGTAQNLSDW